MMGKDGESVGSPMIDANQRNHLPVLTASNPSLDSIRITPIQAATASQSRVVDSAVCLFGIGRRLFFIAFLGSVFWAYSRDETVSKPPVPSPRPTAALTFTPAPSPTRLAYRLAGTVAGAA